MRSNRIFVSPMMVQLYAIVTMLLIGIAFIMSLIKTTYQEVNDALQTFAVQEATSISKEIEFRLEQLEVWGQSNSLSGVKDGILEEEEAKEILRIFAKNKKFLRVGLAGEDGICITSNTGPLDISDREYFISAMNGQSTCSDMLYDKNAPDNQIIVYSIPIMRESEVVGVLFAVDEVKNISEYIYPIYYKGHASISIMDQRGQVIASDGEIDKGLEEGKYGSYGNHKHLEEVYQNMLLNPSGVESVKLNGEVKKIGFASIEKSTGWIVVVSLSNRMVMYQTYKIIYMSILFMVLLIGFFAYYSLSLKKSKILMRQSKIKETFLSRISHEVRTPINGVVGLLQIIQRDYHTGEDITEHLISMGTISDYLLSVVNDTLEVSKLQAGKVQLEEKDFSIEALIHNIKVILYHKAHEKGVTIKVIADEIVADTVMGDENKVQIVLMNLIGNAIKFNKDNGEVTLKISQSIQEEDGILTHFEVIDQGIGIDSKSLKSIFNAFEQADTSITRRYGGTGLGLSISQSYVHLMRGNIEVMSVPGEGSTFSVELPFKSVEEQGQTKDNESREQLVYDFKGYKALVVEDNEINTMIIEDALLQVGLEADYVEDGQQAVEQIEATDKKVYDIILMDIQMPRMDGYTATKIIRQYEKDKCQQRTPIIALTANALQEEIEGLIACGMDAHISKPIDLNKLYYIIDQYVHS